MGAVMSSFNQRVNALLRSCKNKKELIEKAKPYGLKFSYSNCSKKQVAQAIVKAQEKQPAEQPEPAEPAEQPGDPKDEFLQLTESEDVEIIEESRGGKRENSGRPEGQTETHAKVDRCRAIVKSDPTIFFFTSGLFSFWALKTGVYKIAEECDPKAESLALSITKFMRYQWPGLQLDPRIEFGCGILRELKDCFMWGKEIIDKSEQQPESGGDNLAKDISDEVFNKDNE
jgi:hypothetical protein